MTENEARAFALRAADDLIESARQGSKKWEAREGRPSPVTEEDYVNARDEIEERLLALAGLKPRVSRPASESRASVLLTKGELHYLLVVVDGSEEPLLTKKLREAIRA